MICDDRTHVNDALDGAENGGNGLANKGDRAEDTGLANQDVEELLVDLDELQSLCVRDARRR